MMIRTLWLWPLRAAALFAALVIPACTTGTPGQGSSNPGLLWNSQAGSGTTASGSGSVQWIDPNSGLGGGPIGITQIVTSTDDVTYAQYNISTQPPPFNQFVTYIFALEHPLSTDTSSTTITDPEGELLGELNGYRNMIMGNNIGGVGGQIIVGGGSVVLPSFNTGTKCARAHCKHYAAFHAGQKMPAENGWNPHPLTPPANNFAGAPWILQDGIPAATAHPDPNAEGDHVIFTVLGTPADQTNNPGMLTPLRTGMTAYNVNANKGRLGKIGVVTDAVLGEFSYSGLQFDSGLAVHDQILNDDPGLVVDFHPNTYPGWSHLCVGYWVGGAFSNYWDILFIKNPNPAD